MTARSPSDRELSAALRRHLPDRAPDDLRERVRAAAVATPQARRLPVIGGLAPTLGRRVRFAAALAAVLVLTLAGSSLLELPGIGSPRPAPPLPEGDLDAGRYLAFPLPSPDDDLALTLTVPDGWRSMSDPGGFGLVLVPSDAPGTGSPGGVSVQVLDVTTLNDPCSWMGTGDDVPVGPTGDDLVEALRAQTAYAVSEPVHVALGGLAGQRVDIVMPTAVFQGQSATAPGCDEDRYRIWNTTAAGQGGVYAQGPANRWQATVLDVDGTRVVVVVADFPGTSSEDRAEVDGIVNGFRFQP